MGLEIECKNNEGHRENYILITLESECSQEMKKYDEEVGENFNIQVVYVLDSAN